MKYFVVAGLLFMLFGSRAFCQTQSELTIQSGEENKAADRKMDSVYKAILKIYEADTIFVNNIKISQGFWRRYYQSQIKARFPDYPRTEMHYGSMFSMCVTGYAKTIVDARIVELEQWLIGSEQGECASSVRSKESLPKYIPASKTSNE